jgi:hypothetical protein
VSGGLYDQQLRAKVKSQRKNAPNPKSFLCTEHTDPQITVHTQISMYKCKLACRECKLAYRKCRFHPGTSRPLSDAACKCDTGQRYSFKFLNMLTTLKKPMQ